MISILICSSNPRLLSQVHKNIENTIGESYEIISIDNREKNEGICHVYNVLAAKASYPYLCFVHEDVLFERSNWGKKIVGIFNSDEKIGLIGIAGAKYKSKYYSGWFSNTKGLDCSNYIHQYPDKKEKVFLSPNDNKQLQEVVCIDGVFMCCRKEIWLLNKFNENILKGFHFYDIDFSLNIARSYKVMVTYDVELIHITSGGDYGNKWVEIAIYYHEKMKNNLPFFKTELNIKQADRNTISATLDFLKNYKISVKNKIKWVCLQKLYQKPIYYYSILKLFLYQPLRIKRLHQFFKSNE